MGTVYIVHDSGGKNFLPAKDFGELHVMLTGSLDEDMAMHVTSLKEQLAEFCERDFLLPVGDPILMGIAFALVADATDGFFSVLRWDRVKYRYYNVNIQL